MKMWETNVNLIYIFNKCGWLGMLIIIHMLASAADDLIKQTNFQLNLYDIETSSDYEKDIHVLCTNYVVNSNPDTYRRLIMPLLWKNEVAHLLGSNYNLSKSVLRSNFNRLQKHPQRRLMYNNVIKEQEEMGIIERIEDFIQFPTGNLSASFLPNI